MRAHLALPCLVLCVAAGTASAQSISQANEWLQELQDEVADDVATGKPLVVHAHVPLCDNNIIRCGGHGLGDGDNPKTNLYWKTSGGFVGWFGRKGSGWKQVHKARGDGDVLEVRVWKRTLAPSKAIRKRSGKDNVDVYVIAYAWRGSAIRDAMDSFTRDLYGSEPTIVNLDDGTELSGGGDAHIVAFVGHNGWMDVDGYDFEAVAGSNKSRRKKGAIAVACITEDYLAEDVSAPDRVPLLMTRWLLFAGAHSFEGAVTAFARGNDLASIRRTAVKNYAAGQGKSARRVSGAFTNPADDKWKKRPRSATTKRK